MSSVDFSDIQPIGTVLRVDTTQVVIEVEDHEVVPSLQVGGLAAVQGEISTKFLIGVIDSVSRDIASLEWPAEAPISDEWDIETAYTEQRDVVRLVLIGTYYSSVGERINQFRRGADSFPSVARPCWSIEGQNLKVLMEGLVQSVDRDKRLVLGHLLADSNVNAVADGDSLFQRHCAIVGSTGSGKSWTTALLLEQAEKLPYANIVVLDVHGEYASLASQQSEDQDFYRVLRLAGKGMEAGEKEELLHIPHWFLNSEELQALLLDRTDHNAPNQTSRLMHHVRELKAQSIKKLTYFSDEEHFTVDSPIPFGIQDLIGCLRADDTQMVPGKREEKQGEFYGKLTRFIARLETRIGDGRLAFMFDAPTPTPAEDWLAQWANTLLCADDHSPGIKIIDLSQVPSDLIPLITGVLGRLILEIQFWRSPQTRTPVVLICDEAHLYISSSSDIGSEARRAVGVFERIAKEGRKYGTSLVIVSQRPAEVNRTLLSQVSNFIVLRLTNDTDRAAIRSLLPDSMFGLIHSLQLMEVGEAVVVGDAMILPSRIRLHEPKKKPGSSTYAVWSDWTSKPSLEQCVGEAIVRMRRQRRD